MAEQAFLNDGLVDIDSANVSARDSGFLYGAGIFETMRSYNGVVFALDDHLDRLLLSAKSLGINNIYDKKIITDAIEEVLAANELKESRLRLTLTNGPMSVSEDGPKPTLLITATEAEGYPADYYKKGVLVVLCPYRQNPNAMMSCHKTTNYFLRMLGLGFAHQRRAAEALWFTVDNRLAEGCISNIFFVKDSVLYTPPIETPVLPGVMRKNVCQLAVENSIELVEKDLNIDDLLGADEVFMTNVIMKIMPVANIEKHEVGEGKVGVVTKKLSKALESFIEKTCVEKK